MTEKLYRRGRRDAGVAEKIKHENHRKCFRVLCSPLRPLPLCDHCGNAVGRRRNPSQTIGIVSAFDVTQHGETMMKSRFLITLATLATLGAGCARYGSAAGDVAVAPDAASSAVLYAKNLSNEPIELRVLTPGQSRFIGAVSPGETNASVLEPSLLPSGDLYVLGISSDGRRRAVGGPLAVTKGNAIRFTIEPTLSLSRAYVV